MLRRNHDPIDTGRAYSILGDVYEQLGERGRAIELYELAVETLLKTERVLKETAAAAARKLSFFVSVPSYHLQSVRYDEAHIIVV